MHYFSAPVLIPTISCGLERKFIFQTKEKAPGSLPEPGARAEVYLQTFLSVQPNDDRKGSRQQIAVLLLTQTDADLLLRSHSISENGNRVCRNV